MPPDKTLIVISLLLSLVAMRSWAGCEGIAVQVLGSGGPEIADRRASGSYLVWQDGKARVLIDMGGGAALRFEETGATSSDPDVVLFTHLHVDHTADFPALIKSSFFEDRTRALPVLGPSGNEVMPSTSDFVHTLFGAGGAFRYLSAYITADAESAYKIEPRDLELQEGQIQEVYSAADLRIHATRVVHGPIPALAYRVEIGDRSVMFSGDTNGEGALAALARDTDVFVAHNAVPEDAQGVERRLHMPPSVIGRIAAEAGVKKLVLSHRMLRTLGKEEKTRTTIAEHYKGNITFADDLDCFALD